MSLPPSTYTHTPHTPSSRPPVPSTYTSMYWFPARLMCPCWPVSLWPSLKTSRTDARPTNHAPNGRRRLNRHDHSKPSERTESTGVSIASNHPCILSIQSSHLEHAVAPTAVSNMLERAWKQENQNCSVSHLMMPAWPCESTLLHQHEADGSARQVVSGAGGSEGARGALQEHLAHDKRCTDCLGEA